MKKNSLTKLLALTLCAVLALSLFAGCAAKTEETAPAASETTEAAATETTEAATEEAAAEETTEQPAAEEATGLLAEIKAMASWLSAPKHSMHRMSSRISTPTSQAATSGWHSRSPIRSA